MSKNKLSSAGAKKILINSNKNFYKANLHCHSTNSDGAMTPEEIKDYYKRKGYSIVAFSDHEHLIDNSYLNDDGFLAITACELAIKEFAELSTMKKTDMKVCHLNLYAKDPANIMTPCYSRVADHFVNDGIKDIIYRPSKDYIRRYSGEGISEIIAEANRCGFLVTYNHPRWSLENATDYLNYKGLWAVEIFNTSSCEEGLYEYNINTYDDFLRSGQKIACAAADDNHSAESACGGWVVINCDSLSYENVIEAMEGHNMYASTGPVIEELFVEDGYAHITYSGGVFAAMSTRGRRAAKINAENPDGTNTAVFKIEPCDGYVRFDIVDGCGSRANTCAYFLDDMQI